MSTKFEQLLDFLVNEEMDKANELFHEIVVEKSREIYENLIAEEVEAEVEEATEENPDDNVEEASQETDDSIEMEDSFEMEEGDEMEMEEGGNIDMEMEEGEDFDLEEIIRELEGEDEEMEMTSESLDSSDIGKGENTKPSKDASDSTTQDPQGEDLFEELTLDEIVAALREEDEMKEEETEEAPKKELEEAYNVIRFLRSKINEVNLLNAKLLFSNKLFRNNELSESQKMKVIENFDRATTMREVKLVYATIAESLNNRKGKTVVKESKGSASTAQKSTAPRKSVLNEGNDLAARWKKLANLK
jgi:hypothetical protein